jgi:hypothetical protein
MLWVENNVAGYHAAWAAVWLLSENIASWQVSTEATKARNAIGGFIRRHGEEDALVPERFRQAVLVRDIFGNPFRPVAIAPAVLSWNDAVVVRLAQAAYQERHLPAGTLDNGRLAVLADALEEAGCTDAGILGHLRGPGPHVRGCWAVGLCLGKS